MFKFFNFLSAKSKKINHQPASSFLVDPKLLFILCNSLLIEGTPTIVKEGESHVPLIIGTAVGSLVVVTATCIFCCLRKHFRQREITTPARLEALDGPLVEVTYEVCPEDDSSLNTHWQFE